MPFFPGCFFAVQARLCAVVLTVAAASAGPALAQPPAPAGAAATPGATSSGHPAADATTAGAAASGSGASNSGVSSPGASSSGASSSGASSPGTPDPVIASVNGQPIRLSEVNAAAETLPPQARALPPQQLYPMLLEQLIDGRALLVEARKTGLDKDQDVQRLMQAAQDRALESALLNKAIRPQVSDAAVKARYDQQTAGKTGDQEVHARHILVGDEATAKKIIAELRKGGDFAALSKQYSKDPGAAQQGGDLGFFKQADMVPEFATAAFALKDGEVTATPVHTQFGWHVIQVMEHRTTPPPSFEQARDELRQSMVQAAVQQEVAQARSAVTVEKFNMDGTPLRATDTAEPPPPAK